MDVIYSFVGLVFAWSVLGLVLLPILALLEGWIASYIKYATAGEVSLPEYTRKLWGVISPFRHHNWANKKGVDVPIGMLGAMIYICGFVGTTVLTCGDSGIEARPLSQAISQVWFELPLSVGTYIAPVLLVVVSFYGVSLLSRKVFTLKQTLSKHIKDKEAHNV